MSTTLRGVALVLEGPMQAWGGAVIGDNRPTLPFPTRSGVLGLLAACLGIRRVEHARLFRLAEGARVHLRVDSPGTPMVDDQTIQGHPMASNLRQTIQSKRTFLCDASFVAVVVPGPHVTTGELAAALVAPVFAPFLGRRCCVPSRPLLLKAAVEASEILELFDAVPSDPPVPQQGDTDFYLDVDDHPRRLRRLRVRDDLAGPLPRSWRERVLVHVQQPASRTSAQTTATDTIDDWMP